MPLDVICCEKSSFLDVAIARLVEKKHHAVNILTDDASLRSFILITQAYPQLDVIVFTGKKKTIQHKEKVFKKWLSKGERLQVWNPNKGSLSTKGFHKDLNNKQIQQAELIVEASGVVTIESDVTPYMITEDI